MALEIDSQQVIRHILHKCSRTAGPLLRIVRLLRRGMIVRVVEEAPVAARVFCPQNRVVKHALEAVPVSSFAGETKQITRQLEMRITAARRLEVGVGGCYAFAQLSLAGLHKSFIW